MSDRSQSRDMQLQEVEQALGGRYNDGKDCPQVLEIFRAAQTVAQQVGREAGSGAEGGTVLHAYEDVFIGGSARHNIVQALLRQYGETPFLRALHQQNAREADPPAKTQLDLPGNLRKPPEAFLGTTKERMSEHLTRCPVCLHTFRAGFSASVSSILHPDQSDHGTDDESMLDEFDAQR